MAAGKNYNEDTHILIKNEDGSPTTENGLLLIMDVRKNTVFRIPDSPTIRGFFNVYSHDASSKKFNEEKDANIHTYDNAADANIHDNAADENVHTYDNATGVSEIPSDENIPPDNAVWGHSAIMLLFSVYKDHESLFKSDKIRNETVWKKITNFLKEKGYKFTAKQTENKWKNLRKSYVKVKDNNSKSGASFKKCKYYDEMDEIYGKSHSIQPVAVASNLSHTVSAEELQIDEDSSCPTSSKKTKLEQHMHILTERMQKNEEAREKRHKEKLEFQKEALKTYNDIMNRLLEKL